MELSTQVSKSCRICYDDNETFLNYLLLPCSCAGSMKLIHVECLAKWINSRFLFPCIAPYYCTKTFLSRPNAANLSDTQCEMCYTKWSRTTQEIIHASVENTSDKKSIKNAADETINFIELIQRRLQKLL